MFKNKLTKTTLLIALTASVSGLIATQSSAHTITIHQQSANNNVVKNELIAEQLISSIENSNTKSLTALFNSGFDISSSLTGDGTPLIIAVAANNKAMVEF